MKGKKIITWTLLAFVGISVAALVYKEARTKGTAAPSPVGVSERGTKVVAYYFHGNYRCQTCLAIERYAKASIEESFADSLREQRLEFRPVNVDEAANVHYVQDYELQTRSLVLALFQDGRQQKWKTLDEVWLLVGDRGRFDHYVTNEVASLLRELN
jgi:hypothetical protein